MVRLGKLLAAVRAFRAGAPLGDVALLKIDALTGTPRALAGKLPPVRGALAAHDVAALRALPEGTLGRAYARFLDANGITPLAPSAAMLRRFAEAPYAVFYARTHDLHHVLTGFDAGLAGEIGVLGFDAAQGVAPIGRFAFWLVLCLYALISPTQAGRTFSNARVGLRLGAAAKDVMLAPLEDWFARPLAEVRAELRLPDPAAPGVRASGRSLVTDRLYRQPRAAST